MLRLAFYTTTPSASTMISKGTCHGLFQDSCMGMDGMVPTAYYQVQGFPTGISSTTVATSLKEWGWDVIPVKQWSFLGLHGRSCVWKDHSRKASISRSWLNKSKDPWAKFTKFKEPDVAMTATPVVQPRPAAKVQPVVAALATWLYPFITFLTMAYNII